MKTIISIALLLFMPLVTPTPARAAWNPFCVLIGSCGDEKPTSPVKAEEEVRLDLEFELLFGPEPPVSGQPEKAARRTEWLQNRGIFGGLIEAPSSFTREDVSRVADWYLSHETPKPIFYSLTGNQPGRGERALFRSVDGLVRYGTSAENAMRSLNITTASYHVAAIKAGGCIERPHSFVPPHLTLTNCASR